MSITIVSDLLRKLLSFALRRTTSRKSRKNIESIGNHTDNIYNEDRQENHRKDHLPGMTRRDLSETCQRDWNSHQHG